MMMHSSWHATPPPSSCPSPGQAKDRLGAGYSADDRRHTRIVAVTDSDRLAFLEVDAAELLDKRCDEMLARLLAIADDVDARLSLIVQIASA